MKNYAPLAAAALALAAVSAGLPAWATPVWQDDFAKASEQARREGKTVLLDYYAAWCPPCQALNREVFSTDTLKDLEGKLIFVHVDIDQVADKDLLKRYPVTELPTVWLVSPDGKSLARHLGYDAKEEFLSFLNKTLAGQDPAKDLSERIAKSPEDPDLLDEAYTAALNAGDATKAADIMKKVQAKRDDWEGAYKAVRYEECAVRLQAKDTDYATLDALSDRYLSDFPKSYFAPSVVALRAKSLRARGRGAEADALIAGLPARFPEQPPAYWRVLEYSRENATLSEAAKAALEAGLRRYPKQEHFLVQAVLFLRSSDRARAGELARTLTALKPDNGYYKELLESVR